jgi:hypothetical protein
MRLEFMSGSGECFSGGELVESHPGVQEMDGTWIEPPSMEPIIDLGELEAVFAYMSEQFPKGWKIEDGKVISAVPVKKRRAAKAPLKKNTMRLDENGLTLEDDELKVCPDCGGNGCIEDEMGFRMCNTCASMGAIRKDGDDDL